MITKRLDNRTTIFSPICNRDFKIAEDGFMQAVPKGEFFHAETGLTQVVDDASLKAMFNSLVTDTQSRDTLIDFDHFSYDTEKSSEAAGWLSDGKNSVQIRDDGLYIKPRLSDTGRAAIESGRFRFISPVFMPPDIEVISKNRVRPKRVDTWGVTNQPVMKGKPLSNRAGDVPAADNNKHTKGKMKNLMMKLGLSAEAAEEAGIAEVEKLLNRASKSEGQVTTLTQERDTLKTINGELLESTVEADLEKFAPVIKNRDAVKKQLLANRKDTVEFLEGLMPAEDETETTKEKPEVKAPLHNRAAAKTPGSKVTGKEKEADLVAKREGEIEVFKLANRCSYQTARDTVRRLKPELFKEEAAAS